MPCFVQFCRAARTQCSVVMDLCTWAQSSSQTLLRCYDVVYVCSKQPLRKLRDSDSRISSWSRTATVDQTVQRSTSNTMLLPPATQLSHGTERSWMVWPSDVCSTRYTCYNQMLPVDATGIPCNSRDTDIICQWVTELCSSQWRHIFRFTYECLVTCAIVWLLLTHMQVVLASV
jgi:hypothetical protein